MEPIKYFDSMDFLEPHCVGCDSKIDYGVTTNWDDSCESHRCNGCGQKVE